jgi:ferredoxin/flavodoxin
MLDKKQKAVIVYSSPAGTTRHVAEVVKSSLDDMGCLTEMFDLGKPKDCQRLKSAQNSFAAGDCLWVGSPVYAYHALPDVTDVIDDLPELKGVFAVPFVTWGAVSSGLALSEMGRQLGNKGYRIAGAAKIAAVHSMMWQIEKPLAKGRPDCTDNALIADLIKKVYAKINSNEFVSYPVENINYQPESAQKAMQEMSLEKARPMFPKIEADKSLCIKCGKCGDVCPVRAMTCSPYPEVGDNCIFCFNCVRLCEEQAFKIDLLPFGERLRSMAAENNEHPLSKIFV